MKASQRCKPTADQIHFGSQWASFFSSSNFQRNQLPQTLVLSNRWKALQDLHFLVGFDGVATQTCGAEELTHRVELGF